ncbi:MAG: MarR family winged helix-turn-helix transcriptional regulator [bacterium]
MAAKKPKSQAGPDAGESLAGHQRPLLHLILHTARLLEAMIRSELEPLGLHHGQGRVLDVLVDAEHGVTQVQVAQCLGMRETAATQVLRRMHELGLVRRVPDEHNGRAMRVTLTTTGRDAAAQVRSAWTRTESRLVAGLPPQEIRRAQHRRHIATRILNIIKRLVEHPVAIGVAPTHRHAVKQPARGVPTQRPTPAVLVDVLLIQHRLGPLGRLARRGRLTPDRRQTPHVVIAIPLTPVQAVDPAV